MFGQRHPFVFLLLCLSLAACGSDPFTGLLDVGPLPVDVGDVAGDALPEVGDPDTTPDVAPDATDGDATPDATDGDTGGTDVAQDADDTDGTPDAALDVDPEDATTDVTEPAFNACGGAAALEYDGASASPGTACGCGGTLVCNGIDALWCVGSEPTNSCGGCGPLGGRLGDSCGRCDSGTWMCGDGGLVCADEGAGNLCGGCTELEGAPRALCGDGQPPRVWACTGPDAVACQLPEDGNACGGTGALEYEGLDALPGEACESACGSGRLVCDTDAGNLTCDGPDVNECGWCGPLAQLPIGTCGCGDQGRFTCDDGSETVICVGGETNACGGCGALDPAPGGVCDDGGSLACDGTDATQCLPNTDLNACGGTSALALPPGVPCGACDSGSYVCDGTDAVVCRGDMGASAFNTCGGCEPLVGSSGAACGTCGSGISACDAAGGLACEGDLGDDARNACGGCGTLDATPDAACGTCAVWSCVSGGVDCVFDAASAACAELPLTCADLTCGDAFRFCNEGPLEQDATCGECLGGYVDVDGVCMARQCEEGAACETAIGEWSACDWSSACDETSQRRRQRTPSTCVDGFCAAGTPIEDVEDCDARVTDGVSCGASSVCGDGACIALPGPVSGLSASTSNPDRVLVAWSPASGAVQYEVEIDGSGVWIPVSALNYSHAASGAPTLSPCQDAGLSASEGLHLTHVELRCAGAGSSPGAPASYRVRGTNAVGAGPASAPVVGYRAAGTLLYAWQRSGSPGGFINLPGPTTATFNDTTAPEDGTVMYYRVVIGAAGAESVTSEIISGYRIARTFPPLNVVATDDQVSNVRVTWDAPSNATGYQLRVNGGAWLNMGSTREYVDNTAGAPSLSMCSGAGLTASQGTTPVAVRLNCNATTVLGDARTYEVRATGPGGESTTVADTGQRAAGPISTQWHRSADSTPAAFTPLSGATTLAYDDTTAPESGELRWYRVSVAAAGVTGQTSAVVSGFRSSGDLEIGAECETSDECTENNCSSGICAPDGYAFIPAGTFLMGSPEVEYGRCGSSTYSGCGEEAQAQVTISVPFFLAHTETTQGAWAEVSATTPSFRDTCGDDCPVERVSWWEAVRFANLKSAAEGLSPCYALSGCTGAFGAGCTDVSDCIGDFECTSVTLATSCTGYRLPTDAEWEFAYRAGTTTSLYNGQLTAGTTNVFATAIAWHNNETSGQSHEVAQLTPNAHGLFDMAGNVWEWTWDRYETDRSVSDQFDPMGPITGTSRDHRGGYWGSRPYDVRAATRGSSHASARNYDRGFRLVRQAPVRSCDLLLCDELHRGCDDSGPSAGCTTCETGYAEGGSACYRVPAAPVVTASAITTGVELTWPVVDSATGYEISIASGPWLTVGTNRYVDTSAPAPSINPCATAYTAVRSSSTSVTLTCSGTTTTSGATVSYRVRAVNGPVPGAVATTSQGRPASTRYYDWQRRTTSTSAWTSLATPSSTPSRTDTASTSTSQYRLVVSMFGATTEYNPVLSP